MSPRRTPALEHPHHRGESYSRYTVLWSFLYHVGGGFLMSVMLRFGGGCTISEHRSTRLSLRVGGSTRVQRVDSLDDGAQRVAVEAFCFGVGDWWLATMEVLECDLSYR